MKHSRSNEFVRNPYNYDAERASHESGLECLDESRTTQEFVEESDINYIAEKFIRTGQLPQLLEMPTYGDFQGTFDFQSSMNLITKAKQEFMSLPAKVRTRFSNDPQKLLEFINDPENFDEAVKLGFITKETADAKRSQGSTQNVQTQPAGTSGTPPTQGTNPGTEKPGPKAA